MKGNTSGCNMNYALFFLLLSTAALQRAKLSLSEVDLSAPPLLVCECAVRSQTDNECDENFKGWSIVSYGKLKFFNITTTLDSLVKDAIIKNCFEQEAQSDSFCAKLLDRLKKVAILGTGQRREMHRLLDNKENIVLCPNSIHPNLTSLIIKGVKEIYISPEAIMERETSLRFELRNIAGNLIFPIGFYDYNYKISEEGADIITNKKIQKEPVVINLDLFEVNNVKIESNCISTGGVKLSVTYAASLIIESSAVFDLFPGQSGISLKEIDKVDIYSTFSNYLIIDSCKSVTLHTKSISDSIHHLMVSNINHFVTKEYSFTPIKLSLFSISNIRKWTPFSHSIVSQFSEQFHENFENKTFNGQVRIYNSTVSAKGKNSVLLACDKLTIEMSQFVQSSNEENSVEISDGLSSQFWIGLGNYEDSSFGNELSSSAEKGDLGQRQSNENTSTLVFIASSFVTDVGIPNWVYICLLNDSLTCPSGSKVHQCPLGFPYNFGDEDFKQIGCYESRAKIDLWTVFYKFLISFGGGFAVILALLLIYSWIRWHKRRNTWKPDQMNVPYLRSLPSRFEGIPQLVHVPPRESQIAFTFPKRFHGKTTPTKCGTLMAVNLSYGEESNVKMEDNQKGEEKTSSSIELLRVKFLDESVEGSDLTWMDKRLY